MVTHKTLLNAQATGCKQAILLALLLGNYPGIVKLLLQRGIVADTKDLALAKQLDRKEIGRARIVIKYLGATTGHYAVAQTGISQINGITPDIARYIMSHTL